MKAMMIVAIALVSSVGFAHGRRHHHVHALPGYPAPAHCSTAGDETSRPVFRTNADGSWEVVGYECVQDNRGNGGN